MPELTDPDNDGILEFTQTIEDPDGDQVNVTLELDQVNGTEQTGADRDPSWLSFTTSDSISNGSRITDVNAQIDASGLAGAGTTYTFELTGDDGVATSSCSFTLDVESAALFDGKTITIKDSDDLEAEIFNLSTAFDVTSATEKSSSPVNLNVSNVNCLRWGEDGTSLFMLYDENSGDIKKFKFNTAYDPSSFAGEVQDVTMSQYYTIDRTYQFWFKPDGTQIFLANYQDGIVTLDLGTAWDLTTATFNDQTYIIPISNDYHRGIWFRDDGKYLLIYDRVNHFYYDFTLSTAYKINTASSQSSANYDNFEDNIWMNNSGDRIISLVPGTLDFAIYDLSTPYDVSSMTFNQLATINNAGLPKAKAFSF